MPTPSYMRGRAHEQAPETPEYVDYMDPEDEREMMIAQRMSELAREHFKGTGGKIFTPRQHIDPRNTIWSTDFSVKCRSRKAGNFEPEITPYTPSHAWRPPAKKEKVVKEHVKVEELEEFEAQLEAIAADLTKEGKPPPSLNVQIGMLLLDKTFDIPKIVKEWDSKGKGEILQIEFRAHLKSLGLGSTNAQADDLFNYWNNDNSGLLDVYELKQALKGAQREANAYLNAPDPLAERAAVLRKIAAQCREAIDTLNKATEMEEDYTTFAHEMTVNGNLLLGDLLYKRLVKPGAMVAQCSNSAEGGRALTKREFRKFCKTLGLPEALDGDKVDTIFDTYDEDKGGSLSIDEATVMIKSLQDAAAKAEVDKQKKHRDSKAKRRLGKRLAKEAYALADETLREPEVDEEEEKRKAEAEKKRKKKKKKKEAEEGKEGEEEQPQAFATQIEARLHALDEDDVEDLQEIIGRLVELGAVETDEGKQARGFRYWREYHAAHKEFIDGYEKLFLRWLLFDMRRNFQTWVWLCSDNVWMRFIMNRASRFFKNRPMMLAVDQWKQACGIVTHTKRSRELVRRGVHALLLCGGPSRLLMVAVMTAWRGAGKRRAVTWAALPGNEAGGLCAAAARCFRFE